MTNPTGKIPKGTPKAPGKMFHGGINLYIHRSIHHLIQKPNDESIRPVSVLDRALRCRIKSRSHHTQYGPRTGFRYCAPTNGNSLREVGAVAH